MNTVATEELAGWLDDGPGAATSATASAYPGGATMQDPRHSRSRTDGANRDRYLGHDHADSPWNRAAAATAQYDPFCCRTEWALSFHESFARHRALHLRAEGGSVLAFAERRERRLGPVLEPVESHWLCGCPLLGADAVELLDAFLAEFDDSSRPRAVLVSGILPGSRLRRRLAAAFERRWQIFVLEPNHGRGASLDGGLDGFLSRRSGRLRRELRRQQRRAREHGVWFERAAPRSAAEAESVYARMLAVEQKSWKGIGRCGMAEPPSRAFYAAMLGRLAAAGAGRVVFARRGDDDVGFVLGGVCGSVYRGQQFSYDERWQALSIGNLLQVEQVR